MMDTSSIPVSSVVYRTDLYPRIETSPATVQAYAEQLENLPPIEVNERYELIDGWHRWTAHKKAGKDTINCIITPTASDNELLQLAIERNASHGLQLSQSDKQNMAVKLYDGTNKEHLSRYSLFLCGRCALGERKDTTPGGTREEDIRPVAGLSYAGRDCGGCWVIEG